MILRVLGGQQVDRTPVWIMRQAGRYLPEYMSVRARHDFLEICKTPELASEVTIQPVELIGVDAAIIFSDILVLPEAMGMNLVIEEGKGGPRFTNPINSKESLGHLHDSECGLDLKYVADAIKLTVERLDGKVPLIGFCGSPWTLLAYMVEGKGGDFVRARAMLYEDPATAHQLLSRLARNSINYLKMQQEAGASLVQIFDTWAGILSPSMYEEFSLRYINEIVRELAPGVPVIVFSRGANRSIEAISKSGASAVSVDWNIPIEVAARKAGIAVQGNLDPAVLFANAATIKAEARRILAAAPKGRHIFNLGHGVLPNTPVANVRSLVGFVKEWRVD